MRHIDDDMLYRLAESLEGDMYLDDEQKDAMRHISECKECADELMAMRIAVSFTDDFAFEELGEIFRSENTNILAVISVDINNKDDESSVVMKQTEKTISSLSFEAPLTAEISNKEPKKLENVYNKKTYITLDPDTKELFLQIDKSDNDDKLIAYIKSDDGSTTNITLEENGTLLKGSLKQAPEAYKLYIEKADE